MFYRPASALDPDKSHFVLIEDDVLFSDLFTMALQLRIKPADIHVFTHGRAALEHCRKNPPDVAIVDLGLPDMDGRELIRLLQKSAESVRVIVLTGQVTATLPGQLLALGVSGYLDKTSEFTHAEEAIRRVLAGGLYFAANTRVAPEKARFASNPEGGDDVPPEALTEREREICRLVASGLISKEIANRLKLSPRTIEKARAQILGKLRVRDLPALVRWCMRHGLS